MSRFLRIAYLAVLAALASWQSSDALGQGNAAPAHPNVVFIIVDDLNEYVGFLDGHPQALTPNMDALAARSTSFTDAYATLPICAPSRASLFSGIAPFRSGSLSFAPWFENRVLRNSRTMMEYFSLNGYRTLGTGKVFHHNVGYIWDEFHDKADYGPVWIENGVTKAHPSVPHPYADLGPIDGSFAPMSAAGVVDEAGQPYTGWWSIPHKRKVRYISNDDRDLLPDEDSARWAARRIAEMGAAGDAQPFFLAVGLIKPHTPLHVPQEYFDRLPPEDRIVIPNYLRGDADDTGYRTVFGPKARGPLLFAKLDQSYPETEQGLRAFIRAYLAAVAFVDDQVGTVVRAVQSSPFADDTIIVLTGDNGWTSGEKEVLFKNNLWRSGSRVPLLIYRPGRAAQTLDAPVTHIDLYPTLAELAGLSGETRKNRQGRAIDGVSLVPYLDGDAASAPDAALVMLKAANAPFSRSRKPRDQHYALVTRDWRYIRYNLGREELYDRHADPLERINLADDPATLDLRQRFRGRLREMIAARPDRAAKR